MQLKMIFCPVIAIIMMLSLFSQTAIAQYDSDQLLDFYSIEIIVFRHAGRADPAYRWPGQPDTSLATDLFPTGQASGRPFDFFDSDEPRQAVYGDAAANLDVLQDRSTPGPVLGEIGQPSPIYALADDELLLADAWRRLDRNRGYQPLLHMGWRQAASPFGEALPVRIHGGAMIVEAPERSPFLPFSNDIGAEAGNQSVEELDGSIAFERGRFLHLRVDLALHVPLEEESISRQPAMTLRDSTISAAFDEPYRTYRMVERRQIHSGTLNYFDHRRFGLITLVEKWEPTLEEPAIAGSDSPDPEP